MYLELCLPIAAVVQHLALLPSNVLPPRCSCMIAIFNILLKVSVYFHQWYFSSLNKIFIGTTIDFLTKAELLVDTDGFGFSRVGKFSSNTFIVYVTARSSSCWPSSALESTSFSVRLCLLFWGRLSLQSNSQGGKLLIPIANRVVSASGCVHLWQRCIPCINN